MAVTVVVDLGCATHHGRDSVRGLISKYHPRLLLGFDPLATPGVSMIGHTLVIVANAAAWTSDGCVTFHEDGWESKVVGGEVGDGDRLVVCFDLATLLTALPGAVLKMDVEGAEYALLAHLQERRVEPGSLLIEWHDGPRLGLLSGTTCTIEEWWM